LIGKNIDLIAVAFLLAGLAAFSSAKHVVVMSASGPMHYIRLECGRQVRIPVMPRVPMVPHIPRIPLNRD
jgi:hypothetical protein